MPRIPLFVPSRTTQSASSSNLPNLSGGGSLVPGLSASLPGGELGLVEEPGGPWSQVPWRTIVASVGVVLATFAMVELVLEAVTIIWLIVIGGFLAVVLSPLGHRIEARLGGRHTLATTIVVLTSALALVGVISLFVWPVRNQAITAITDLPGTIQAAGRGRGPFGNLVARLNLSDYVLDNQASLTKAAERLRGTNIELAQLILTAVIAFFTVVVLAFSFLLQSQGMAKGAMSMVPHRRQEAVRRVGAEIGQAISGYMIGNLLVSLVAGSTAFICLLVLGVPSPVVLALWVAFADLIPLIGATLGAVAGTFAAFLHSSTAGIAALVFFVVYQQFENSVLQPAVMARTVKVNPAMVIISVLLGVELFGIGGALLAIPVAGSLQIVSKAIRDERMRDRLHLADSSTTG